MGVKITIDQAPKWVSDLQGKMRAAALRGLLSAAHRTVEHIQTEVIPREERVPVDRGIYKAGWRARKIAGSAARESNGRFSANGGALVYNATPHAPMIEYGVRADNVKVGRRMIDALAEWVVRKGLTGTSVKENQASSGRQIAWAIAQSMKKKGIFGGEGKGLRILEKARKRIPEFIVEEVKREIDNMHL